MKLMYKIIRCTVLSLLPAVCILSCTSDTSVTGGTTETTSANVIGTILYENNCRAAGVTVKLIPSGFNPSIDSNVDSVVTNEQGSFAFKVSKSGYFNLCSQSQDQYCYTDSIFCQANKLTVVNDTLRTFGFVGGRIGLTSSSRIKDILVLVMGTNTYAIPDSITGIFTIPFLAEGSYVFRILTPEKLYEYIDTIVTVSAGKKTILPEIVIPFVSIPELGHTQATVDRRMMVSSLSWPSQDSSEIAGYYVFRNSGITDTPLAVINCPDTVFQDDLLLLDSASLPFGDTIRYCIAAIGKDRTFKKISSFQNILFKNTLVTVDTIILPESFHSGDWISLVLTDKNKNIYLYGWTEVAKLSQTGQLMARYEESNVFIRALSVDKNGNVYGYDQNENKLIKFTPNLLPIKDTTLKELTPYTSYFITVSEDTCIGLFYTDAINRITFSFDSTLSFKKRTSVNLTPDISVSFCYNLIFRKEQIDPDTKDTLLTFYDSENRIVKNLNGKHINQSGLLPYSIYEAYCLPFSESNQLLALFSNITNHQYYDALIVLNPDNTVYGRANIREVDFFDGVSKLYSFDNYNSVLYIYTIQ
jgi:hypothetical protein